MTLTLKKGFTKSNNVLESIHTHDVILQQKLGLWELSLLTKISEQPSLLKWAAYNVETNAMYYVYKIAREIACKKIICMICGWLQ